MGFFSWETSDTKESISNVFSCKGTFPVFMQAEDGRIFQENEYRGYGIFGDKDIYELIAELNGKKTRDEGIDLTFNNNPSGDFQQAVLNGVKCPKLFSKEISKKDWYKFSYPENCKYQGYFYN